MERVTIEAELRTPGRDALREARKSGKIAGLLCGGDGESLSIQMASRQLVAVLGSGRKHNRLFQLSVKDGENTLAMVGEEQWHPLKQTLTHVDFKRVRTDQKVQLPMSVTHTGMPEGVKLQGGVFEVVLHQVNIECLPADLPDELTVDVTPLGLNQAIRVSDLQKLVGDRVKILNDANAVVFHIVSPRAEEAAPVAAVPAEGAATEPEVIKKGKTEAEGEAAAETKDTKKK
jgi:large subunit ribosomal protein L25